MTDDTIIRISAPAKRKPAALGRGLGALLGDMREDAATPSGSAHGLAMLPIAQIEPDPGQPRRQFDEAALDELAASIAQRGVIQPIIVRRLAVDRYRLVAGERRWRAAQRAHLAEIPALVRDLTDRDVLALALIENLQREDLNPIEEARAYQRLANEEGMTQADIARMVDKSRSHVANLQRLLALPDPVIALVESGALTMGHARALIGADSAADIAQTAVARQLSVRQVEALARRGGAAKRVKTAPHAKATAADDADLIAVQTQLEELLGLPVRIVTDGSANSGAVTIGYRTLDQLDLVCQRLSGGAI